MPQENIRIVFKNEEKTINGRCPCLAIGRLLGQDKWDVSLIFPDFLLIFLSLIF